MGKSVKNRHDKYGVFIKWCGGSNKKDKIIANRKFRRYSKIDINNPEDLNLVYDLNEVSNVYNFNTDGLCYYLKFSKGSRWTEEPYTDYDIKKFRMK